MSVRASTRTSAPVEAVTPATGDTSDTALYQLKRFSEAADKIRANATTAAKTLGGLGTAGIAAVGVAKFSDVFPLPGNGDGRAVLLAIAVIVGFALMLGAVLLLTGRMWQVGEPVFTTSDVDTMVRMRAVTERERPLVDAVYQETVDLNFKPNEPAVTVPRQPNFRNQAVSQPRRGLRLVPPRSRRRWR